MSGFQIAPPVWKPRGLTPGQDWSCVFTLTNSYTGKGRLVSGAWGAISRDTGLNPTLLARFDTAGSPGQIVISTARVSLHLPGALTAAWMACDAYFEMWLAENVNDPPYPLIKATPFPIRIDEATLL